MKKIFTAVLLGTALSVSACGGSDEPAPVKTVYAQPSPEPVEPQRQNEVIPDNGFSNDEDEFLIDVADFMTPALRNEPQADVVELGYVICEAFEAGQSIDDVIANGGGYLSDEDVIVIAAAATVNLCPGVSSDGSSST